MYTINDHLDFILNVRIPLAYFKPFNNAHKDVLKK